MRAHAAISGSRLGQWASFLDLARALDVYPWICFFTEPHILFKYCVGKDLNPVPCGMIPYGITCFSQFIQKSELRERVGHYALTIPRLFGAFI
jgi:hypothetical protein